MQSKRIVRQHMSWRILIALGSWILGVFLVAVGVDKLVHLDQFYAALGNYWFLGPFSQAVGTVVIMLEVVSGIGLLIQPIRRVSAFIASVTLVAVSIGATIQYALKPETSCGCWFTLGQSNLSPLHIVSNLGIAMLLFVTALMHEPPINPNNTNQPQQEIRQ